MITIETGKEIRLENVLSLRKKMTQMETQQEMMNIRKYLEENGVRKNGPIVTATFAVEKVNEQPIFDMEILVQMDKKLSLVGVYRLKEEFHLVNAVYARHKGNPNNLQSTYNEIMAYINQNNLQQITAGYNVNVVDLKPGDSIENMIIDVYIGVNPSIL